MKKVFMVTLLCAMYLCSFAQGYDRDFKYNLFSNLEIGAAGIYSYSLDFKQHNVGTELRVTKQIGDYWKVRGIANVNGFIPNGFDRYGKALIGVSFGKMFYGFVDYGVVCNPSSSQTFGMAMDGGLGLNFNLGEVTRLYVEGGIDRVNNGNLWQSNIFAKTGLLFNLGIVKNDKVKQSIKDNQVELIKELRIENKELHEEVIQSEKNKADLQQDTTTNTEEMVVYFDYTSTKVTIDLTKYAEIIKKGGYYRIDGYTSNNGINHWSISKDRATAVIEELIRLGVNRNNLIAVGNGKTEQFGNKPEDNQCVYIRKIE